MRVDAILTGDLHLREDPPICRTDDFLKAQEKKLMWLRDLQKKYRCPVIDSGDVFHKWKSSPWLLKLAIDLLPNEFYTIPGNHDLPGHNLNQFDKSGLAVLISAGVAKWPKKAVCGLSCPVYSFPWGTSPKPRSDESRKTESLAIAHIMVWQGEIPWPGCEDPSAKQFLRKMKGYKLVLTGHNHKPFVEELNGRLLVNPGSLMRTTVDQINHKPRVYLWDQEKNCVTPEYVPIETEVISREHLEKKEERDKRISAFIERLSDNYEISGNFQSNLEKFYSINKIRESVKRIIANAMDMGR